MNTTSLTTISVTAKELKKNYIINAMDILFDMLHSEDIDMWEVQYNMIQDVLKEINTDGFKELFQDGQSALLLSQKDLDDVENFQPSEDKKLQLVISHIGREDEVIELQDIVF